MSASGEWVFGFVVCFLLLAGSTLVLGTTLGLAPRLAGRGLLRPRNAYLGRARRGVSVHGAVTGWKVATVGLGADGVMRFAGVTHTLPYLPDDDALCAQGHRHDVPTRSCSCGFHAYRDRAAASAHSEAPTALLRVALSGRFVEYEKGFRTSHQRVERVEFRDTCPCGRAGVAFTLCSPAPFPRELGLVPRMRCEVCVPELARVNGRASLLALEDLAEALAAGLPAGRPHEVVAPRTALTRDQLDLLCTPLVESPPRRTPLTRRVSDHLRERLAERLSACHDRAQLRLRGLR